MTVYVDNMKMGCKFYRWNGVWSNLWADTTEELLAFADDLGLSMLSMIDQGFVTERFMINESRRRDALDLGATGIAFGGTSMAAIIRRKRQSDGWKTKGVGK